MDSPRARGPSGELSVEPIAKLKSWRSKPKKRGKIITMNPTTSPEQPSPDDRSLVAAFIGVGVSGLSFTLVAFAASGVALASAVALGALLALLNLWLLSRAVRAFLGSEARPAWGALAVVKLLLLVLAGYMLFRVGFDLLALGAGFAAMPIGIVIAQLFPRRFQEGEQNA